MLWNNLKTHCHIVIFDAQKKIALVSETLQNSDIGQLYSDYGLK